MIGLPQVSWLQIVCVWVLSIALNFPTWGHLKAELSFFGLIINISTFKIEYKEKKNNFIILLLTKQPKMQTSNRQHFTPSSGDLSGLCLISGLNLHVLPHPFLTLMPFLRLPPCLDFLLAIQLLILGHLYDQCWYHLVQKGYMVRWYTSTLF